jgi:hypothetical protein
MSETDQTTAWRAAGDWHHAYFTGIVLAAVARLGTPVAAELVYRVFCTQREARFLPGLAKLGLDGLPHAVAAAQYHYLSNDVGGVAVQYMPESDRKAWVRYVPPRWIWAGTALCGIPSEITVAMLRGWHAQNGLMLGNPRLGFVCTKMTTDGDASLEGYYIEEDRPLEPDERLRFARDEDGPDFDPSAVPVLASASWPLERLARARRNYAMEYVRTVLPVALGLLGEDAGGRFLHLAGRLVGMQHHRDAAEALGLPAGGSAEGFAAFLAAMARGQGSEVAVSTHRDGSMRVVQQGPRIADGTGALRPAAIGAWSGLWEGALASHDPRMALEIEVGDTSVAWTVSRRR